MMPPLAMISVTITSMIALASLVTLAVHSAEIPLADRSSSYDQMSRETRTMQDDDTANPGMFWVLDGEALWRDKRNFSQKACSDCHGDASISMKDVFARHPVAGQQSGRVTNIEAQINICRTERQSAATLLFESKELLALTAFIARQSKGQPISVKDDPETQEAIARGRSIWERRQGQLNLSCAHCHDDNWGKKLAGAPVPQAHPTGYPIYRLEWQTLGSLQRRLRNCMTGMRAESYAPGSPEFADLELFLMWRARGMMMESPGVRP
jgi:L-cysteine S-thiosulfotransferase